MRPFEMTKPDARLFAAIDGGSMADAAAGKERLEVVQALLDPDHFGWPLRRAAKAPYGSRTQH